MGYFIFLTIFDCVWMIIWTILTHQALRLNLVLNVKPENGQSPKPWISKSNFQNHGSLWETAHAAADVCVFSKSKTRLMMANIRSEMQTICQDKPGPRRPG